MGWVCRRILISSMLLATSLRLSAADSAEDREFRDANKSLAAGFYERAEKEFASFSQKYTNSARLPEAILCQAEARLRQTNYAGTIELLLARQITAGAWA